MNATCAMPGCLIEGEHAMDAHLPPPLRIRVEVTADDIAAGAKPDHPEDPNYHSQYNRLWAVPVERALTRLSGQNVDIDGGSSDTPAVATIGQDAWSLVVDLPPDATAWLERRWRCEPVPGGPIQFEIEIPAWVVGLVGPEPTS